jgi:class 3 adenylate cyclase
VKGQFLGILTQVVPVFRLSRDMGLIARESNVTPFVLYGRDWVLAHPQLSVDEVQSVDHLLPDIASLGDRVLSQFYLPTRTEPIGMRALKSGKSSLVRVDDDRYIVVFRELDRFGPTMLTVGANINTDRVPEGWPMRRAMQALVASLIVLAVAIGVAVFVGRRLSEPVRTLAKAASTAREGRLEEVARGLLTGNGELEPVEGKATALICDIEDFTKLTNSLGPRRVVEFLNSYFEAMACIIERYNGVITQFQGDAVLAVFNISIRDREHAAHALAAAIEMVRVTDEREFAGVRVRNRIGISTGRMLAGAVGSRGRLTYTVHGNTANVAARIEAMNNEFGTRIFLSGKTAERCSGFELRKVSEVEVRGYDERVTLFTPDLAPVAVPHQELNEEA